MSFVALIQAILKWLSDNWSAIAVVLFNVEEKRVDEAKSKQEQAELNLELEKNKITIEEKYNHTSDRDVILDALKGSGGSEPEPGKPKKDS